MTTGRAGQRGVALFVTLMLLFILTLLLVEGISTAASEGQLAANQQFFDRAFEAAQGGLASGLQRLARSGDLALPQSFTLAREGSATEGSETQLLAVGSDSLPTGYSTGRFIARHYEIRSRGSSARSARSDLVQGAVRVEPVNAGTPVLSP
ncbi:MAG: PilX N-terminal domain-containing pilus assembly protein [Pseudomonadota bacterium]